MPAITDASPLLRIVEELNRHDPSAFVPFTCGGQQVGLLRRDFAAGTLDGLGDTFTVTPDRVALNGHDHDSRSALLESAIRALAAEGRFRLRGEPYPLLAGWGRETLATFDRGACDLLGVLAYGVHVNGIARRDDGLHMWVGRRALDRPAWPGKLDNIIGGGLGAGYTAHETLIKEGYEEAGFDEAIMRQAVATGLVRYRQDTGTGIRQHTIFLYDLELPEGVTPANTDGEVAEFLLLPIRRVIEIVLQGGQFKENCNLVIIDFLIRHGYITPETQGYEALAPGLLRV